MKIDRLIGILSVLLQEEKVTAPELADKFEVSRRTINRDIENCAKREYRLQLHRDLAAASALWTAIGWTEPC